MPEIGPAPLSRDERRRFCRDIADRLREVYGDRLLAVGVYGSVSRDADGPYSDIEMLCVLRDSDEPVEFSYEWAAGSCKAEVDVYSADVLLQDAATLGAKWPLTHGCYFSQWALYDPEGFFPRLRQAAESPTEEDFRRNIREVLVGEMYEFIGKVRNIRSRGPRTHLPFMAVKTAEYGAMLIGLHHRKLFSTGAMVLPEALELSDRPAGFDRLAQMVMSGELTDPEAIVSACEAFWNGLMEWADRHGYAFDTVRIPF